MASARFNSTIPICAPSQVSTGGRATTTRACLQRAWVPSCQSTTKSRMPRLCGNLRSVLSSLGVGWWERVSLLLHFPSGNRQFHREQSRAIQRPGRVLHGRGGEACCQCQYTELEPECRACAGISPLRSVLSLGVGWSCERVDLLVAFSQWEKTIPSRAVSRGTTTPGMFCRGGRLPDG